MKNIIKDVNCLDCSVVKKYKIIIQRNKERNQSIEIVFCTLSSDLTIVNMQQLYRCRMICL